MTRAVMRINHERAQAELTRLLRWHLWLIAAAQSVVIWNTLIEVAR